MKKTALIVLLVTLSVFPPSVLLPVSQAQEAQIQVTRGTPVALRVTQLVSSETSHLGDVVHMEVVRDVIVNNAVVIKAGTPADGEVIVAENKGFIGEAGKIGITVKETTAIDGQTIYLRSSLHREGEDKQMLSLILGLVLCFLFLFMKGKESEVFAGSEVKAYVDNDIAVKV